MSTPSDDYTTLAGRLGYAESKRFRALLENLMTPDQAKMAAALPGSPADVADKTGFDETVIKENLEKLFFKGVVIPKGDFENRMFYRFPRSVGQFHDATQATKARDVEDKDDIEFYSLWHDFVMEEWYPDMGKVFTENARPHQRIVPAHPALEGLDGVLPHEDMRELLKAQETIAVVPCACRFRTAAVEEPCAHFDEVNIWSCLQFGRGAQYVLARNTGKRLSTDEALELLDKVVEDGLLHMWRNNDAMTGVNTSCQCCRDCCMSYVPMDIVGESIGNVWEKSRYEAFIVQDKCDGCQDCVERCEFDAIDMIKPEAVGKAKRSKKLKAAIDPEKCWGCGVCVIACDEASAIGFKVVRDADHIPVAKAR